MGGIGLAQRVFRWMVHSDMRRRLRGLDLPETVLDLRWEQHEDGFTVSDGEGRVVAGLRPLGDGQVVEVYMSEECPHGWRLSLHRGFGPALREVKRLAWYQESERRAKDAERERNLEARRPAVDVMARELGIGDGPAGRRVRSAGAGGSVMGKAVFFEGVERWFLRWLMRSRLRRLGLKEPVVELSWGRGGGGFGVHDGNGREVATVRPVGDGRLLEVRMIEVSEYGWRLSSHRKVESARREVEGTGLVPGLRAAGGAGGEGTGRGRAAAGRGAAGAGAGDGP